MQEKKKYNQTAYNIKSREKTGSKAVNFTFDAETLALFNRLVEQTGQSKISVIKSALACYAKELD